MYALAGNPGAADAANSYPYAHRSSLNDVTSGSNGTCGAPLCTAGAGYDGPTGTAQNDKLTVTLGASTPATYSNLDKASGYVQKTFNVTAPAGQTVTLKFSGTENSSRRTSFVVDDTALTVG